MVGVGATERPLGPFGLGYGAQGVGLGRRIWRLVPAKEYQGETPIHGDSAPSNRRFMIFNWQGFYCCRIRRGVRSPVRMSRYFDGRAGAAPVSREAFAHTGGAKLTPMAWSKMTSHC